MCWSIDRWGEVAEIRKDLEVEREEAVKALLDSLPEPAEVQGVPPVRETP